MQTDAEHDLWERLRALELDVPDATLPFSARLARENGWSRAFARRAIEEYRRFVFLAATSERPVTPSGEVDQVWHLHLTYTRSYWEDLCGRVLGRALHHDPTRGGRAEGARYHGQYASTLARYRAAFGEEPPADLWPPPDVRMAGESLIRQVSARTHWVVAKPRVAPWAVLAATSFAIAGCSRFEASVVGVVLLGTVTVVWLAQVLARSLAPARPGRRRDAGSSDGGGWPTDGGDGWWGHGHHDDGGHHGGDSGCSGGDSGGDGGCGGGGCGGCGGD